MIHNALLYIELCVGTHSGRLRFKLSVDFFSPQNSSYDVKVVPVKCDIMWGATEGSKVRAGLISLLVW